MNKATKARWVSFSSYKKEAVGTGFFSIPDYLAWMQYFDTELDPTQFENVIGRVSVDMDQLATAV